MVSLLAMGFLGVFGGSALAQETKDIHVEFGWRAWAVTVDRFQGSKYGDGFMSGPTFALDLDRKWSLGFAYLDTDNLGDELEPVKVRGGRHLERPSNRTDIDLSLRYRLIEGLGVYLNFKRVEDEFTNRSGSLTHFDIQGIGAGVFGGYPIWAPTKESSVFLTGSGGWLPLAWQHATGTTGTGERARFDWLPLRLGSATLTLSALSPSLRSLATDGRCTALRIRGRAPRSIAPPLISMVRLLRST
jgi:hypothetical protein